MTEVHEPLSHPDPTDRREAREPLSAVPPRVGERVVIRELGKPVVPRVGVAAGAVVSTVTNRVVVVALNKEKLRLTKSMHRAIRVWPKPTGIT
jgi:hypothetical protein